MSVYQADLPVGTKVYFKGPVEPLKSMAVLKVNENLWCVKAVPRSSLRPYKAELKAQFIRKANQVDLRRLGEQKLKSDKALQLALKQALTLGLSMRVSRAIVSFDERQLFLYFTASQRIDFRFLLKGLRSKLPYQIALRQLSARSESAFFGGLGSCGRELCCSTFFNDFDNLTIELAKDQALPPNPARLSGNCGRLKCCLKYELDYYLFMKEQMPPLGAQVKVGELQGKVVQHYILDNSIDILSKGKCSKVILGSSKWSLV